MLELKLCCLITVSQAKECYCQSFIRDSIEPKLNIMIKISLNNILNQRFKIPVTLSIKLSEFRFGILWMRKPKKSSRIHADSTNSLNWEVKNILSWTKNLNHSWNSFLLISKICKGWRNVECCYDWTSYKSYDIRQVLDSNWEINKIFISFSKKKK